MQMVALFCAAERRSAAVPSQGVKGTAARPWLKYRNVVGVFFPTPPLTAGDGLGFCRAIAAAFDRPNGPAFRGERFYARSQRFSLGRQTIFIIRPTRCDGVVSPSYDKGCTRITGPSLSLRILRSIWN